MSFRTTNTGGFGASPLETRLTRTAFNQTFSATTAQSQVDGALTHLLNQSDQLVGTFLPLVAGGTAARLARTGILAIGAHAGGWVARLVKGAAELGSLGAEVVGFETAHRSIIGLIDPIRPMNLWRWSGEGGLKQGFFGSAITFGTLRGGGRLAQGQNIVVQHAIQSAAMVAGHNLAGVLNILPRPVTELAAQFFEAETTNVHLGSVMGALHHAAPGLHAFERGMDLSFQVHNSPQPPLTLRGGEETPLLRVRGGGKGLRSLHPLLAGLAVFSYADLARAATALHESSPSGSSWALMGGLFALGLGAVVRGRSPLNRALSAQVESFLRKYRRRDLFLTSSDRNDFRTMISHPDLTPDQRTEIYRVLLNRLSRFYNDTTSDSREEFALTLIEHSRLEPHQTRLLWRAIVESPRGLNEIGSRFGHPHLDSTERAQLVNEILRRFDRPLSEDKRNNPEVYIGTFPFMRTVGELLGSDLLTPAQRNELYQRVLTRLRFDGVVPVVERVFLSPHFTEEQRLALYQELRRIVSQEDIRLERDSRFFPALTRLFETTFLDEAEHRRVFEREGPFSNEPPSASDNNQQALLRRLGWASVLLNSPSLGIREKNSLFDFIRNAMTSPDRNIQNAAYHFARHINHETYQRELFDELVERLERNPLSRPSSADEDFYLALHFLFSSSLDSERQERLTRALQDDYGLREESLPCNYSFYSRLVSDLDRVDDFSSSLRFLATLARNSILDFRDMQHPRYRPGDSPMEYKRIDGLSIARHLFVRSRLGEGERETLFQAILKMAEVDPVGPTHRPHVIVDLIENGGLTPDQVRALWTRIQPLWDSSYYYARTRSVLIGAEIYESPHLSEETREAIYQQVYKQIYDLPDGEILTAARILIQSARLPLEKQERLLTRIQMLFTYWYDRPEEPKWRFSAGEILFDLEKILAHPFEPIPLLDFFATVARSNVLPSRYQKTWQSWLTGLGKYSPEILTSFLTSLFVARANSIRRGLPLRGPQARNNRVGGIGYNFFWEQALQNPQWRNSIVSLLSETFPRFYQYYDERTYAVQAMEDMISKLSFESIDQAGLFWDSLESQLPPEAQCFVARALRRNIARDAHRARLEKLVGTENPSEAQRESARESYRSLLRRLNSSIRTIYSSSESNN